MLSPSSVWTTTAGFAQPENIRAKKRIAGKEMRFKRYDIAEPPFNVILYFTYIL
jgi:hypothetical protein